MTNRNLAHTAPFGSLPTAGGGIARAAYSAAIKARLDIDPLLKSSGLTAVQLKNPDTRIAVKTQIKFLNQIAGALRDDFLGIHLAQRVDLRELGLLYYVLASSETLGDALARAARYSTIQNEGVQLTLRNRSTSILGLSTLAYLEGAIGIRLSFLCLFCSDYVES